VNAAFTSAKVYIGLLTCQSNSLCEPGSSVKEPFESSLKQQ
jgi:hypothetical protein